MSRRILAMIAGLIIMLLAGCGATIKSINAEEGTIALTEPEKGELKVEKMGDGSLLLVKYFGEYAFKDYLKTGVKSDEELIGFLNGKRLETYEKLMKYSSRQLSFFCSCFSAYNAKGECIFGRNFDYYPEDTVVMLYTRPIDGYASVSMVDGAFVGYFNETNADVDKEHLLTAPYFTIDGMNEYGLAVALNSADGMAGNDPGKVTIGSNAAIRLVLEGAKDVDEALELLERYNIYFQGGVPVHYLISDAEGQSAVVELAGRNLVIKRSSKPWQVLTNFYIGNFEDEETAVSACNRYKTAFNTLKKNNGILKDNEPLDLLRRIKRKDNLWAVLYNKSTGEIQVASRQNFDSIYKFRLQMK